MRHQIDYQELAISYNKLAIHDTLSLDKVYNITKVRKIIERYGIVADEDFTIRSLRGKTVIRKVSGKRMSLTVVGY